MGSTLKAEVYFNYTTSPTSGGVLESILCDPRFGILEVRAFGTYVLGKDPAVFIREVVGTMAISRPRTLPTNFDMIV